MNNYWFENGIRCRMCSFWTPPEDFHWSDLEANPKGLCQRFPEPRDTLPDHSCGEFRLSKSIHFLHLIAENKIAYLLIQKLKGENKKLKDTLKKRNEQLKAIRQKEL